MRKGQSKQMISNLFSNQSLIFLKFCYFLCFVILLSCGGDSSKKESNTPIEVVETESAIATNKNILFFGDSLTAGYGLMT